MGLGMVGLGRMGANMARRLIRAGHRVMAYDVSHAAVTTLVGEGPLARRRRMAGGTAQPRAVWVMVPATNDA